MGCDRCFPSKRIRFSWTFCSKLNTFRSSFKEDLDYAESLGVFLSILTRIVITLPKSRFWSKWNMHTRFNVGDRVVFTRDKHTTKPGPRAKNVFATPHGETYEYQVDKYWLVAEVLHDGHVVLLTRRGKRHVLPTADPRLRKASFWERLFKANRFPNGLGLTESSKNEGEPNSSSI
jgi:hypothetical protein